MSDGLGDPQKNANDIGNKETENIVSELTNNEVLNLWKKILKL